MKRLRHWHFDQNEIVITEDRGVRLLHRGGGAIQSAMRLSAPDALELHYTRAMMAFLLLHPSPVSVLQIGLGGGSMAKFLYRHFPVLHITTVELDPRMAQAAWEHFGLPARDDRLEVLFGDGAQHVPAHPDSCDVLLLDAFEDSQQVSALTTEDFYQSAFKALRPGGILVANFMSGDRKLGRWQRHMEQAFAGRVLRLQALDQVNTILFALREGPTRIGLDVLRQRAAVLQQRFDLPMERLLHGLLQANPCSARYLRLAPVTSTAITE